MVYFLVFVSVFLGFFVSVFWRFWQQAEYSFPSITVLTVASMHGFSGSVGVQCGHFLFCVFACFFTFSPQFWSAVSCSNPVLRREGHLQPSWSNAF